MHGSSVSESGSESGSGSGFGYWDRVGYMKMKMKAKVIRRVGSKFKNEKWLDESASQVDKYGVWSLSLEYRRGCRPTIDIRTSHCEARCVGS